MTKTDDTRLLMKQKTVVIVGAGPAGLMAAEVVSAAGYQVHVYDAKPSACRKFLIAGVGGMNITHSEPYTTFITRYYEKSQWLASAISQFDGEAVRAWISSFDMSSFVGSSGRVFTEDMKAAPLLRKWLKRLREAGVEFHMRHRLVNLSNATNVSNVTSTASQPIHQLHVEHDDNAVAVQADAVILAMGGASWPKLGSDGAWQQLLTDNGVEISPLQSANCGFYSHWSEYLQAKYAGEPLKNIAFNFTNEQDQLICTKGECIVTKDGMEGSLIYAFSKYLREQINTTGSAQLLIDLLPDFTEAQLLKKLSAPQGKDSFSKYLKRTVGLSGLKVALLHECFTKQQLQTPASLVTCIKNTAVTFTQTKAIEQAISSAGGVCQNSVNDYFMLNKLAGIFCAGEMLDWEAPTGGYLLTACFATGRLAGKGVVEYLA